MKVLSCTVQDYLGQKRTARLTKASDSANLASALSFATFIKNATCGTIVAYGVSESAIPPESFSDITAGHYDRVQQKLRLNWKDAGEEESVALTIHAPLDSVVDVHQEPDSALVSAAETMIGSLTEREANDLIYNGGGLTGKPPKNKQSVS